MMSTYARPPRSSPATGVLTPQRPPATVDMHEAFPDAPKQSHNIQEDPGPRRPVLKTKRKRSESWHSQSLLLDTAFGGVANEGQESGSDTPRTLVSKRLEGLQIKSPGTFEGPELDLNDHSFERSQSPSEIIRKRLDNTRSTQHAGEHVKKTTLESSPSQTKSTQPSHGPQQSEVAVSTPPRAAANRTIKPPSPLDSPQSSDSPSKRRKRTRSPPPSQVEDPLTWHDDEITGHLMSSPDDDGTGMNGVGFRATAQQEAIRSQKRRQQVQDWRERENREARGRRAERRLMGVACKVEGQAAGGGGDGDESERRTVRFA